MKSPRTILASPSTKQQQDSVKIVLLGRDWTRGGEIVLGRCHSVEICGTTVICTPDAEQFTDKELLDLMALIYPGPDIYMMVGEGTQVEKWEKVFGKGADIKTLTKKTRDLVETNFDKKKLGAPCDFEQLVTQILLERKTKLSTANPERHPRMTSDGLVECVSNRGSAGSGPHTSGHTSSSHGAAPCHGSHTDHSGPLTLVLLGESGSGKSASGNTILERKAFPSETSSRAITIKCAKESKSMYGTTFEVIDTPDFSDENLQQPDEHVKECRDLCRGGLCVYLLVIQLGRFTEGERGILERLETALETRIRDRAIILFTYGDDLKPDQRIDYVRNTNTHLQRLIKECGDRYQVFNNRKRDDQQVKGLMGEIAAMVNTDHFKIFPELNAEKSFFSWPSWNFFSSKN